MKEFGRDWHAPTLKRRQFVKMLSVAFGSAPALYLAARSELAFSALPQNKTPQQVLDEGPPNASWKIVLASPDEPGEPMIVRGTIFGADGKTPIDGGRMEWRPLGGFC